MFTVPEYLTNKAFKLSLLWMAIITICVKGHSSNAQTQQNLYSYAYITQSSPNLLMLNFVNPENPNAGIPALTLQTPTNHSLIDAQSSPDGLWVMFMFGNSAERLIYLLNIESEEIEEIAHLNYHDDIYIDRILPVWSPDSKYLAFNAKLQTETLISTYIYSLQSRSITRVKQGTDVNVPFRLAWSPDSSHLAIISGICTVYPCWGLIETFGIPSGNYEAGKQFTIINTDLCNLNWSPDNSSISFQAGCDFERGLYFSEVFVWNLAQDLLVPLTSFSNSVSGQELQQSDVHSTLYNQVWFDSQNLFLGIRTGKVNLGVGIDETSAQVQTLIYKPSNNASVPLMPVVASEWAINRISQEIAYRVEDTIVDANLEFSVQNAAIEIATFDGQDFSILASFPAGCNIQWSPDGTYLSYVNTGTWLFSSNCTNPQGLSFIHKVSRQIRAYNLPNQAAIPVGWVANQN